MLRIKDQMFKKIIQFTYKQHNCCKPKNQFKEYLVTTKEQNNKKIKGLSL